MEKMYWLTCNNTDCGYPHLALLAASHPSHEKHRASIAVAHGPGSPKFSMS